MRVTKRSRSPVPFTHRAVLAVGFVSSEFSRRTGVSTPSEKQPSSIEWELLIPEIQCRSEHVCAQKRGQGESVRIYSIDSCMFACSRVKTAPYTTNRDKGDQCEGRPSTTGTEQTERATDLMGPPHPSPSVSDGEHITFEWFRVSVTKIEKLEVGRTVVPFDE